MCRTLVLTVLFVATVLTLGCEGMPTEVPFPFTNEKKATFDPTPYPTLGVLAVDNTGQADPGTVRRVEDEFITTALEKNYRVGARSSDIERVIRELKFQESGMTDRDYKQVGKILNVSAIWVVSINGAHVKDETVRNPLAGWKEEDATMAYTSIGTCLISVESGEFIWLHSEEGRQEVEQPATGLEAAVVAARAAAGQLPTRK